MNVNQRPIPEAALRDENAVEVLRVWIAEKKLHCSMTIGMYHESTNIPEEQAWGMILADIARHVASGLGTGYSGNREQSLQKIRDNFIKELADPTSDVRGAFARPN